MFQPLVLMAVTLPLLLSAPEEFRCTYIRKVECDETGCSPGQIGSAFLLIPHPDSLVRATISARYARGSLPQIRRCDDRGCTPLEVTAVPSGMFINISSTGGGYYLKIVANGMDQVKRGMFVESATVFLTTVTYWGSCAIR